MAGEFSLLPEPLEFYTMSSVRTNDSKRGIPLDWVNFLVETNALAKTAARTQFDIPAGQSVDDSHLIHTHLIGDACLVGVEMARRARGNLRESIANISDAFNSTATVGTDEDTLVKLELPKYVEEKVALAESIVKIFGLKCVEVLSSAEFLRENYFYFSQVLTLLGAMFNDDVRGQSYSITRMLKESLPPAEGEEIETSLRLLAKGTLPKSLRRAGASEEEIFAQGFYGGMEGAIAAVVINNGGYYASYRGSEMAHDRPIIENMRLLVQMAVHYVLGNTLWSGVINRRFLISDLFDGRGLQYDRAKDVYYPVSCDPHTLDDRSTEGISVSSAVPPQKLPFLPFDISQAVPQLRAATSDEFLAVLRGQGDTFSIARGRESVWLHNIAPCVRYLETGDRLHKDGRIQGLLAAHRVNMQAVEKWVGDAKKRFFKLRTEGRTNSLIPMIPGGNLPFMADLNALMASDVMTEFQRIQAERHPAAREEAPIEIRGGTNVESADADTTSGVVIEPEVSSSVAAAPEGEDKVGKEST